MNRPLPLDREKALAAIANGWGREATAAHPLCRCGKPKADLPSYQAYADIDDYLGALETWIGEHGSQWRSHYDRRECPVHGPAQ